MNKIIKYILAIFMTLLSVYLVFIMNSLDVLPMKYMLVFVFIIVLFNIIGHLTLFVKNMWSKIITCICYSVLVTVSFLGINYGLNTLDFLNKAFNNNDVEVTTYNLIVLNNKGIDDIKSLEDKDVAIMDNDNNRDEVLKELKGKVKVVEKTYTDIYDVYNAFLNSKIVGAFIDSSLLEIIDEEPSMCDCEEVRFFKDDYKVLYTYEIENKKEKIKDNVKLEPMNIYLSGSDSRSNTIQNKSRSDVNMILTINPDTKTVLMTSIPRDYYVSVNGKTGLKDKLTHAGIYGIDTSRKTLEDLFDIDIPYSIKISMSSVVEIVDLVGGVDINSDTEFNSYHYSGWRVKKGINHMDGAHALAYSRERYAYASGDRHRILNQQQVLEAVLKKIVSDKTILTKYDKLLDSLSNMYRTDIPSSLITDLVKRQIDDMSGWKFLSNSVSGSDALSATYTAPNSKRYVMIPYERDVSGAHEKIEAVLKGTN